MKKLCLGIILVVFCIVVSNSVVGITENTNDIVLTLTYGDEHKDYTLDDLLAFDSITGNGGRLKVTGEVIPPNEYTGVLITTLAQEFTDMPSQYSITVIADDGYIMNYTYEETQGEVMVYDTQGNEIGVGGVSMILATKENGQTGYDGSLRIAFINQDEPITFSALWAKYVVEIVFKTNAPPNKPDKPSGRTSGKVGETYDYIVTTTDPEGDDVYYWVEWCPDCQDAKWQGPYTSGDKITLSHAWEKQGTFSIKVKAKDVYGAVSEWSDSLVVSMPKNKAITMPLLKFIEQHTVLHSLLQRFLQI